MKRVLFCLLILALMLSTLGTGSAEAAVKKVRLLVGNDSREFVDITLRGPVTIVLKKVGAAGRYKIEPGIYQYSYRSCGQLHTGILDATSNARLKILRCPMGTSKYTFTVRNSTGEGMTLQLISSMDSNTYNLPPGDTLITVLRIRYRYVAIGCGGKMIKGKIHFYHGGPDPWVFKCR